MDVFTYTAVELEDLMDNVKSVIVRDLVKKGLLSIEGAELYAATHTIIIRKKGFFRTVTDRWLKQKTDGDYAIIVVNRNIPDIVEEYIKERKDYDKKGNSSGPDGKFDGADNSTDVSNKKLNKITELFPDK